MKKVSLLLCLALAICLLAACGHEHQYSNEWSADSEGHWYEAICDCEDIDITKKPHVDTDNDGVCDECRFADHVHTYSSKWSTDSEYHWKAADCGHKVDDERGKHADENIDGLCDVCKMVMGDPDHIHTYKDDYAYDSTYHWLIPTCEHIGATQKAEHESVAGICTVCGYGTENIDVNNIAAVIAASEAQRKLVCSGSMTYITGGELPTITERVSYVLGKNATHLSSHVNIADGNYDTYTETWLELNGESVFAVQTVKELKNGVISGADGTSLDVVAMTPERLLGPYIPHSTLNIDEESSYSIEAILGNIYAFSQSSAARDLKTTNNTSDRSVTFSFGYVAAEKLSVSDSLGGTQAGEGDNADTESETVYHCNYFTIIASFKYSENFVITEASLTINSYTDQTLDKYVTGDGLIKPDITYDPATGNVSFTADAMPDTYTTTVTQTEGSRTYTSKYPQAELIPTQFELEYNGNKVENSLNVPIGEVVFTLGSMIPSSADPKFMDIEKITYALISNATGEEAGAAWMFDGKLHIYIPEAGSYTYEYTYKNETKSIQLTAMANPPESIKSFVMHEVSNFGSTWNEISDTIADDSISGPKDSYTVAVGETLYFLVKTMPFIAEQGYTYSFSDSNATLTKETVKNVMVFNEFMSSCELFKFTASAKGTYVINYTSTVDTSITGTFTITVE